MLPNFGDEKGITIIMQYNMKKLKLEKYVPAAVKVFCCNFRSAVLAGSDSSVTDMNVDDGLNGTDIFE